MRRRASFADTGMLTDKKTITIKQQDEEDEYAIKDVMGLMGNKKAKVRKSRFVVAVSE